MPLQKPQSVLTWKQDILLDDVYVPRQSDRIAIIGAGPAGLHMAFLLGEIGFKNVTILEKESRFAGKSFTGYNYEPFVPQEFGTCYTIPYKYGELRRVAKKIGYASFEEVPVPKRHVFENYSDRKSSGQDDWLVSEKVRRWPFSMLPAIAARAAIGADLLRYNHHHEELFRQDLDSILEQTNMTFEEYLKLHNFEDLAPLFSLATTVQGYGYISEVPAFYGLWWNNPDEVNGFLASALKVKAQPASILRHGFQLFWEFLYKNRQIQVQENVEIKRVERGYDGVKIWDRNGQVKEYDFLIVTSNLREALSFLDADGEEEEFLGGLKVQANLTTTLVSVKHTQDPVPISSWTSSLRAKNRTRLMTVRNSYKIFFPDNFGKRGKDFLLAYQYEPEASPDNEEHREFMSQVLVEDLCEAGYEDVVVHEQHIWPYFQRYNQDGLNAKYPVKLARRQGKRRTWYAGASAMFESVHDCMEHNKMLVRKILTKL